MPDSPESDAGHSSVAATAKTEVRKTVVNATGIFAVVGAIAAVMEIYNLLNKEEPNLHAEVHLSESFIPPGSKVTLSPEELALWPYVRNDALSRYCNKKTSEGKTNFYKNDDNCDRVKNMTDQIAGSIKYGEQKVERDVIDLVNTGRDVASNVKLRTAVAGHILIKDQADKTLVERDVDAGDVVSIANLNPSESVKITVDSKEGEFQNQANLPLPTITHSKGSASVSTYRIVPPLFADIVDVAQGIPKIILIFLFVVVSFIVTISTIMIVAVANAILRGKSIASVFQS